MQVGEVRVPTTDIRVAGRHRKDLGDIAALARSIKQIGLINPITVAPDHGLIAGQRRLEACRSLGWTDIPVRVVSSLGDATARLVAERDENTERKGMAMSELMALADALEELERSGASARIAHGKTAPGRPSNSRSIDDGRSNASAPRGGGVRSQIVDRHETREAVAGALGMSRGLYSRAREVHHQRNDPDPDIASKAEELAAKIDAGTRTVTGAHKELRRLRREKEKKEAMTSKTNGRIYIRGSDLIKAADQRKAIESLSHKLAGMIDGLSRIGQLHAEIEPAEARAWEASLRQSRTELNTFIRLLQERSNAEADYEEPSPEQAQR